MPASGVNTVAPRRSGAVSGAAAAGGGAARRAPYDAASLLDVAVKVFNERGYDGTSMEDLARAAGISKSSFYHHVDGKEALLAAACDRALAALSAIHDEPESNEGRAIDRFEHVLRRTIEALIAELPYVTLLLRVRGNTATEKRALERRREFDRFTAGLVTQAIADGDLRSDIDPLLATRLAFGLVNSLTEW
ncbi:MAG TPA: TetR/AcrR family transcriptional regulator, partial [Acidothermaceae bacterium]|nr:TetR/AcrR family transcriptional regulator [Acidothermaceae bacterium]